MVFGPSLGQVARARKAMVQVLMQKRHEQAAFAATGAGQLALPLDRAEDFTRAGFICAPSNLEARAWLGHERWPEGRLVLWGDGGSGKTHLLRLWAARGGAGGMMLCEGPALSQGDVPALLDNPCGIALDDADRVPCERALLHLLNAAREAAVPVLMAARLPPARWPVVLPDLQSRLRATVAVGLGRPDESLLRALLMRHLAERQIVVAQPVMEWLLRRLPRSPDSVREAVMRLDRAGLEAGGRITRAMAQDVLDSMAETMPPSGPDAISP